MLLAKNGQSIKVTLSKFSSFSLFSPEGVGGGTVGIFLGVPKSTQNFGPKKVAHSRNEKNSGGYIK